MESLDTILTQNLAALSMAAIFIWYLVKKDKSSAEKDRQIQETFECFNKTIQNHLQHSLKTEVKVANSLSRLANYIKQAVNNNNKK